MSENSIEENQVRPTSIVRPESAAVCFGIDGTKSQDTAGLSVKVCPAMVASTTDQGRSRRPAPEPGHAPSDTGVGTSGSSTSTRRGGRQSRVSTEHRP